MYAVLLSAKVGVLALEALVVSKFIHREALQVVEEIVVGILESGVLIQLFEFDALESLFFHLLFESPNLTGQLEDLRVIGCLDFDALALGTVQELEHDAGREPPILEDSKHTVHVENVSAVETDTRGLAQAN